MDSFEINKIIAAVILVVVLVVGIDKLSTFIFHVDKPETPGYTIEVEQVASTTTAEEKIDITSLLAMGDIAHGEKLPAHPHTVNYPMACNLCNPNKD